MALVYALLLLLGLDIFLYVRNWKTFAKKYFFLDYGIGVGWAITYKLMGNK